MLTGRADDMVPAGRLTRYYKLCGDGAEEYDVPLAPVIQGAPCRRIGSQSDDS
jgi:hypothetical protein